VRVVAAGMTTKASSTDPRSGRVVTIVQCVKSMREMDCMTYRGEEDTEVVGHWARKVESRKSYKSNTGARGATGGLRDTTIN